MEVDGSGYEVLAQDECLRLLAEAKYGRVALNVGALPTVVPVGCVLTADGIVISALPERWFLTATENAVVAFETDVIDPVEGLCWSVVVIGPTDLLSSVEPEERGRLRAQLGAWVHREAEHLVRISVGLVSGRRALIQDADTTLRRPAA